MQSREEQVSKRVLTVPNVISMLRLALVPVFVVLFVTRRDDQASFLLLVLIGSTDWIDGYVARRFNQVSVLGKLIDPVADRIAVIAIMAALTFRGTIPLIISAVILVREVIISIAVIALEAKGYPRLPVNRVGKAATAAIYFGVAFAVSDLFLWDGGLGRSAAYVLLWVGAILYWVALGLYLKAMQDLPKSKS